MNVDCEIIWIYAKVFNCSPFDLIDVQEKYLRYQRDFMCPFLQVRNSNVHYIHFLNNPRQ